MTRARTHIRAVGISPLIQPLLEAVLCVVVSLVHHVVTRFGMRLFRRNHDWHMAPAAEALPQTKPDIHIKENLTTPTASFSGLSRESLLETPKGLAVSPLETINRDSRDKPENDLADVEAPEQEADVFVRVPRAGGDPASAQRALHKRTALTPRPTLRVEPQTNVGIQGEPCVLSHPAASSLHQQANRSRIPANAGMSGKGCWKSA